MKCLTLNEMLDLIHNDGDAEAYERFAAAANALADIVAAHICAKHNVECTKAATEEHELGGTAVNFGPINPEDAEPEPFKDFDQGQIWGE